MANKSKVDFEKKTFVTPLARAAYVSLFKRKVYQGKETKFGLQLIVPKSDEDGNETDMSGYKKAIHMAKVEHYGKDQAKWPKVRSPRKDGDKDHPKDKEYKNAWYFDVGSNKEIQVLDKDKSEITEEEQKKLYSGCYVQARIVASVYAATRKGENDGICLTVLAVKKVSDGPRLGGGDSSNYFEDSSDDSDSDDTSDDDSDDSDSDDSDDSDGDSGFGF